MGLFPYLNRSSRTFILVVATLLTVLIGVLDYVTGVEISLLIFYLLPVCLVSWYADRTWGIVFSLIAAIFWLWADIGPGNHVYSDAAIPYWNATVRFASFLIVSLILTQRKNAERKVEAVLSTLEIQNRQITVLEQAGHLLQACSETSEVMDVLRTSISSLFPNGKGAFFTINPSRDHLQKEFSWGGLEIRQVHTPQDCWALRSGNSYLRAKNEVLCKHIEPTPTSPSLCVPMVAHGDTLGMMHLQHEPLGETEQRFFAALAEQGALALSNLRLREVLKLQAIRDPLTGLFNRRYLEESLIREILRAEREKTPISVMMMDIDHFKLFNDQLGHSAGDAVLQAVGVFLRSSIRGADIACRYGGEEFLLVLPNSPLEEALRRAEDLRVRIKQLGVKHGGRLLSSISVSIGIAAFPKNGTMVDELLQAADSALYVAKKAGRDRVEIEGAQAAS